MHTDREYYHAVENNEPAATSEVADEVGVSRQEADRRLRKLESQGKVKKKKVGVSLVWYL